MRVIFTGIPKAKNGAYTPSFILSFYSLLSCRSPSLLPNINQFEHIHYTTHCIASYRIASYIASHRSITLAAALPFFPFSTSYFSFHPHHPPAFSLFYFQIRNIVIYPFLTPFDFCLYSPFSIPAKKTYSGGRFLRVSQVSERGCLLVCTLTPIASRTVFFFSFFFNLKRDQLGISFFFSHSSFFYCH